MRPAFKSRSCRAPITVQRVDRGRLPPPACIRSAGAECSFRCRRIRLVEHRWSGIVSCSAGERQGAAVRHGLRQRRWPRPHPIQLHPDCRRRRRRRCFRCRRRRSQADLANGRRRRGRNRLRRQVPVRKGRCWRVRTARCSVLSGPALSANGCGRSRQLRPRSAFRLRQSRRPRIGQFGAFPGVANQVTLQRAQRTVARTRQRVWIDHVGRGAARADNQHGFCVDIVVFKTISAFR